MTKFVQWVFFINIHLSILSIGWSEQPIWRGGDSANIRLHCSRIHWKTREEPPSSSLNLLGIGMIRGGSEPAGLATTCDDTNVDCGRDDNEVSDPQHQYQIEWCPNDIFDVLDAANRYQRRRGR